MKEQELLQKMAKEIASLKAENTQLREALDESNELVSKLTARLDIIDQRAAARARKQFSTSSERAAHTDESEDPIPEDTQFDEAEQTQSIDQSGKKPKQPRKKSIGRMKFSDTLPREEIIVDPVEFSQLGTGDPHSMRRIGEDVVEVLDYQPGVLKVKRYILSKYVDPKNPDAGVLQGSRPKDRIIRGGMVSNGLLAAAFSDKFIYHLPYARQSIRFKSIGCPVSRQNLSRWQIQWFLRTVCTTNPLLGVPDSAVKYA